MLTLLAGAFMAAAGFLRLGRYVRFVSRSVMLGFLSGVSVNIVLGQIPHLLGVSTKQGLNLTKALDALLHPGAINWPSAITGILAILLLVGVGRTRLSIAASLVAVVVPSMAVIVLGADSVERVSDANTIPTGLPPLVLPHLVDLTPSIILGALSVAAVVLVQGAGVAEAAPNATGGPADVNRNFIAQGAANVAASFIHGIPVGGSVSGTAMNKTVGARSRWSSVYAGLWMLIIIVALAAVVSQVATPTLAAVLIVVGVSSLRPGEVATVWRTHPTAKIAMTATFVATLTLPVAAAVGTGLVISLLLQLNREALDLRVVEMSRNADGQVIERPAPATLPDRSVTVLDVYGSLLYAGAGTLATRLPQPHGSVQPVVVLRLRGRTALGATFFAMITTYSAALADVGGRLYLSGVDPAMIERYRHSYAHDTRGDIQVFEATEVVGESTLLALAEARTWLVAHADQSDAGTGTQTGDG